MLCMHLSHKESCLSVHYTTVIYSECMVQVHVYYLLNAYIRYLGGRIEGLK